MAERADGQRHLGALSTLAEELPTERLMKETQNLLTALGERALSTVSHLGDGGGIGLKSPVKPLLKMGAQQVLEKVKDTVKDKVKDAVPLLGGGGGDGGGKGKKLKVTNIVEQIDVGVPVSVAYDQWTRFEDFPGFMKKVEDVEQTSDEEIDWKAQIFLSHREWHAEIIDQVPDQHIVWRSRGQKGHVDGAVTFHEIAPDLTRILLVLQYHPQGFFEHTGNLWRAQGRRARLELKHYRRHVMSEVILHPDDVQGWRGEIHDGEVAPAQDEDHEDEEPRDEYDEGDEYDDEERGARGGEDEYDQEAEAEGEYEEDADEEGVEEPRRRARR
ncbi:SRPBCC family protein [Streptomyces sp. NPDC000941]